VRKKIIKVSNRLAAEEEVQERGAVWGSGTMGKTKDVYIIMDGKDVKARRLKSMVQKYIS